MSGLKSSVAAGRLACRRGRHLAARPKSSEPSVPSIFVRSPPGKMPGSTAGQRPAATSAAVQAASVLHGKTRSQG